VFGTSERVTVGNGGVLNLSEKSKKTQTLLKREVATWKWD
jgi:hypothetical protein